MPLLRPYAAFSSFTRRAAPRSIRQSAAARPISSTCARFAQGYGDGEGDPKGETPQDQGPSNGTKQAEVEQHNKEFEQGHDRAPPAAEDKVDKKFWQGKGGSADHE